MPDRRAAHPVSVRASLRRAARNAVCRRHIETIPAGPLFSEGEPATCFYVLIEGELVMSARTAGVDVQTNRTSQRGAYCGAWSAYVPDAEQKYAVSVRLVRPSRFFVLDAAKFAQFMQTQFPMA